MVTREQIRCAYLLLLGREPESEEAYRAHSSHSDILAMRQAMIRSEEALQRLRHDIRDLATERPFDCLHALLVFIHIEKTGGMSLYHWLTQQFAPGRASPHLTSIASCTMSELNSFDFVAGHIRYQEALALPGSPKRLIALFRDPFARLMSLYRFHRAHPVGLRFYHLVQLAQDLPPIAFFRHERVRNDPLVDNAYLRTFGRVSTDEEFPVGPAASRALAVALEHVTSLDAVGLTEHMDASARLIAALCGLTPPAALTDFNVTNRLHLNRSGFLTVEEFSMTPDLQAVMMPLVEHDLEIHKLAERLFWRQLGSLDRPEAPIVTSETIAAPMPRKSALSAFDARPAAAAPPIPQKRS